MSGQGRPLLPTILSTPLVWVSVAVGVLGVVIHLFLYQGKRLSKKHPTIPGLAPSDPQQGNLSDIAKAGGIHPFLTSLHKHYGPIVSFWWGSTQAVSLASPALFKQVSKIFNRPVDVFSPLEPLIGKDAITFANDEDGRRRHAAYARCYNQGSLSNYYSIYQQLTNGLVTKLGTTAGQKIDMQEDFFSLAIAALAKASFGHIFDSNDEIKAYYHHHMQVWDELEIRAIEGPPEAGSERDQKFNNSLNVMRGTMQRSIRMRKEFRQDTAEPITIDVIIDVAEKNEAQKLGDALDIFFAGFHTTGLVLTWGVYYLAKHQDVQEKLYQELCEVLGDEGAVDNDNIGRLVYIRQVIDETLRCSALVTYTGRRNDTEMTIDGHVLAPMTSMFFAMGVIVEDKKLWPDPDRFDPERFSPENRKAMQRYQFEPFGFAGKRICPGYRFSITECITVLSILCRKFKMHLADDHNEPVTKRYSVLTAPNEKIFLKVEKRV